VRSPSLVPDHGVWQTLEAEVQELRMRLSSVEVVARSPVAPSVAPSIGGLGGAPFGGGGGVAPAAELAAAAYAYSAGGGFGDSLDPSAFASAVDSQNAMAGAYPGIDGAYGGAAASLPPMPSAGYGLPSAFGGDGSYAPSGHEALLAATCGYDALSATAPLAMCTPAMAAMGGASQQPFGEDEMADGGLGRAVDAKLRELVPALHVAAAASAPPLPPAPPPAAEPADVSAGLASTAPAGTQFGLPQRARNSGAAALRISRQELDARVQQILGRHGQALAELGSAAPTPKP
jgi:hypothetical protein